MSSTGRAAIRPCHRPTDSVCPLGNLSAWKSLCEALPRCTNEVLPSVLVAMLQMLRSGIDPADVWAQRCALARRLMVNRHHRRPVEAGAWRWDMPADLGAEGWRTDWLLWQGCRHLPEARQARDAMAADLCYQTDLLRVMWPWWQLADHDQAALPEFLAAMLAHARVHRPMPKETRQCLGTLSEQLLQSEARTASPVCWETQTLLRRAAHDFLLKHLPRCQVLMLMAHQIADHPVEVRSDLVRLLADPPHQADSRLSGPEFRQLAQLLILSGRLPAGFRPVSTRAKPFDPTLWRRP